MRVEVYWNVHKKCFSIRHNGRVIAHASNLVLDNVSFVVQPAGRKKVLWTKRKNVHAFFRGTLYMHVSTSNQCCVEKNTFQDILLNQYYTSSGCSVGYNPYTSNSFYKHDRDMTPILKSDRVFGSTKDNQTPDLVAHTVGEN